MTDDIEIWDLPERLELEDALEIFVETMSDELREALQQSGERGVELALPSLEKLCRETCADPLTPELEAAIHEACRAALMGVAFSHLEPRGTA
jgi:hypothetical protein